MKSKLLGLCLLHSALCLSAFGQGSSINLFTYQGRLTDTNGPVNGLYDFSFSLYDSSFSTTQIGTSVMRQFLPVTNGLFAIPLDFPGSVNLFAGPDRWLEIAVKPSGGGETNVTLSPRQQITAAPYAIRAATANSATMAEVLIGGISAGQIAGTLSLSQLPAGVLTNGASNANLTGNFSGDGAGLTNVAVAFNTLSSGAISLAGGFSLSSSPVVASSPYSVAAADVNGDGKMDLISANTFGNTVSVLTNDGNAGFVLALTRSVGNRPYSIIAADVNGDGKADLITANLVSDNLTVLINNGSGGFSAASAPAGDGPVGVISADVNGDGKVDLISVNQSASTLSVLTNNGSGGFALSSSPGVGSSPSSLTAADVNGDGWVDLITANRSANALTVLTNNRNGGFTLSSAPATGDLPVSVTAADVNGDGKVDLISANLSSASCCVPGSLSVLTNNGGGGFTLAASLVAGVFPQSVAAADVTGDGRVDLIAVHSASPGLLLVWRNNGNGSFAPGFPVEVGNLPESVIAAEVNGDGKLDLITANAGATTLSVLINAPAFNGTFNGSGAGLTNLVAANLSGTLTDAQIDSLDAAKITSGTLADARLSANVALRGGGNAFTGNQTITGGNVGLGTTSPQGSLHVYSANNPTVVRVQSTGTPGFGRVEFVSNPQGDANEWRPSYIQSTDNGGFAGGLSFVVNGSGFANRFAEVEVMRVVNGAVGIGTTTPVSALQVVGTVTATAFNPPSDRNLKENFAPVSPREVLEKVAALPISRWNFKGDAATLHVGPMAQDFHAAFSLGTDDKHIATVDADGVALAAIQGLNEKLKEKDARITELERRLEKLERRADLKPN